jgi:hypothetical protein
VQRERERAAVQVARVNRLALLAQVAMQRAGKLSEMEARMAHMASYGEKRYEAIADAALMGMANIVQQQSLDG